MDAIPALILLRQGNYRGAIEYLRPAVDLWPEEAAYQVVKTIFTHSKELIAVHKSSKHWTIENTLAAPPIPFHPGAIRYFREIGAWTDAHQKRQDALLAKR